MSRRTPKYRASKAASLILKGLCSNSDKEAIEFIDAIGLVDAFEKCLMRLVSEGLPRRDAHAIVAEELQLIGKRRRSQKLPSLKLQTSFKNQTNSTYKRKTRKVASKCARYQSTPPLPDGKIASQKVTYEEKSTDNEAQIVEDLEKKMSLKKEKQMAAVTIQKNYRRYRNKVRKRESDEEEKNPATRTRTLAPLRQEPTADADSDAATTIQRRYRKHLQKREQTESSSSVTATIITRGPVENLQNCDFQDKENDKRTYIEEQKDLDGAANVIQRRYKRHRTNRVEAAKVIQAKYRSHHQERIRAAKVIQSNYRRYNQKKHKAAKVIQGSYRRRHRERVQAANIIQTRYKSHHQKRLQSAKKPGQTRDNAAKIIQRRYRKHRLLADDDEDATEDEIPPPNAPMDVNDTSRHEAAVVIQRRYKEHRQRSSSSSSSRSRLAAASGNVADVDHELN